MLPLALIAVSALCTLRVASADVEDCAAGQQAVPDTLLLQTLLSLDSGAKEDAVPAERLELQHQDKTLLLEEHLSRGTAGMLAPVPFANSADSAEVSGFTIWCTQHAQFVTGAIAFVFAMLWFVLCYTCGCFRWGKDD
eukprot:TRINITY_DN110755_c0_g1_i1.p1 TRINITY_DN110755_c0_g1~~TRINITY_DN110755_c0_g1_i1.p1  ORF type:complete len:138 (-),score=29.16 TRINITY_DN110755_c0_g1_i1:64-477(-)